MINPFKRTIHLDVDQYFQMIKQIKCDIKAEMMQKILSEIKKDVAECLQKICVEEEVKQLFKNDKR